MNSGPKLCGRLTAAGWLVVRLFGISSSQAFFSVLLCSRQPTFCFQVLGHIVCRISCFCLHTSFARSSAHLVDIFQFFQRLFFLWVPVQRLICMNSVFISLSVFFLLHRCKMCCLLHVVWVSETWWWGDGFASGLKVFTKDQKIDCP